MPRFAANLSMMFADVPLIQRFGRAAAAGFEAVEVLFPYELPAGAIRDELDRHGLQLVLFNLPPGDFAAGERGLASLPGREAEFAAGLERALAYASALGCPTLHCMAGLLPAQAARPERLGLFEANLRQAAAAAAAAGRTIVIEPINQRDMPGYLISLQEDAAAIIARVGAANLRLQFDCYHCQVEQGDLATRLEALMPVIGHVQVAGIPERHEPDTGEVAYPWLFDRLDALGYQGWVGTEYRPRGLTEDGLAWFAPYRRR